MLTASDMKRLVKLGVSAEALAVTAEIVERYALEAATVTVNPPRGGKSSAERQRKYRQNRKSVTVTTVTATVTEPVTPSPTPPLVDTSKVLENKGSEEVRKKEDTENARDSDIAERDALFEKFWAAMPKRAGNNSKKAAKAKFVTLVRNGGNAATVTDGALRYKLFCDATGKTGTEKVQQAITWLNQAGWETDYGNVIVPTKMTPEWEPSQDTLVDLMQHRGFTDDELRHELELFRTYHIARGTMLVDWNAEFVNRMLKVREWKKNDRRN